MDKQSSANDGTTSTSQATTSVVTLDSVMKDMIHWRAHKHQYKGHAIPDDLWLKIFQLEASYSAKLIRATYKISTSQYRTKKQALCPTDAHTEAASTAPAHDQPTATAQTSSSSPFCEVNIQPEPPPTISSLSQASAQATDALTTLKKTNHSPADYLDNSTVIVECLHPKGYRLNIHTTTARLAEVMQTFYHTLEPQS